MSITTITTMGRLALVLCSAATLSACNTPPPTGRAAVAVLLPTVGNAVTGQLRFVGQGERLNVQGEVRGLVPYRTHGFHIHEKGDCSSSDGMAAGGHFNPHGHAHGAFSASVHHAGDLPSLQADANGVAQVQFASQHLQLTPSATNAVGRSLIVHRDPDDFTTQPSGNAGPRLACAVIALE